MKKMRNTCLALTACGAAGMFAWWIYKKYNPDYMKDMEKAYRTLSRDVEKSIDDMV